MNTPRHLFFFILAIATSIAITGCGAGPSSGAGAGNPPLVFNGITGTVYTGLQPISGATVQFYATGNTGYGSAFIYTSGTSLLGTTTLATATDGSFSLKSALNCPAGNPDVYVVATGGSPGTGAPANTHIALMTALGPCLGINSKAHLTLNELTTVASVWALSPFMTGIANVGTSATNSVGLTNAFITANQLVNTSNGSAGGPSLPSNATLPLAMMNSVADILAACANSSGSANACNLLFGSTAINNVTPTDTITAALNIAQHPNLNTASLLTLATTSSPFQPTLAVPYPNGLSLVMSYSGGGLSTPKGLALDSAGNVWTANVNNTVSQFSNTGLALSGATGYTVGSLNAPAAVATDSNGNAWITNSGNNTVTKISSGGATGTVFSGGNMSTPSGIAIDASSNVWVANAGNGSVTQIANTGALSNYVGGGVSTPTSIAIDPK